MAMRCIGGLKLDLSCHGDCLHQWKEQPVSLVVCDSLELEIEMGVLASGEQLNPQSS